MMQARRIGDARITRILEYAAPTHDPAFLFPDLPQADLDRQGAWLAPHHYIAHMNRLIVTIQLWIVHAGGNVIVVDTGVGNRKPRGVARMNLLNNQILPWLEAAEAAPAQVTHVVHTHLHCDHVGWDTVQADGRWVPTFPNARYLLPKVDFDYFTAEAEQRVNPIIDNALTDSVLPILEAGLADFIDGQKEIAGGVLGVEPAPGHSPGQLTFRVRSQGEEAIFSADVMHSPVQVVAPEINTSYCLDPAQARASRAALLARAAEREALIMPMHFGAPHCGYIRRQGDGYVFEGATW